MLSIAGQLRKTVDLSAADSMCPIDGLSDLGKQPAAGIRMCGSIIGYANSSGTPWNGKSNVWFGYFEAIKASAQLSASKPMNSRFAFSLSNFMLPLSHFTKI